MLCPTKVVKIRYFAIFANTLGMLPKYFDLGRGKSFPRGKGFRIGVTWIEKCGGEKFRKLHQLLD